MSTLQVGTRINPTYVWEVPVRIWHWVMAACMVVLAVTGYFIGSPPPSIGGEASDSFLFGYIRFAHFAAAYIFSVVFVWRVLWAFFGNRFSREIFLVPFKMLSPTWWGGFIDQTKHYLFMQREVRPWLGHNPLAMAAMFFMYVLGTVFMILHRLLRCTARAWAWTAGHSGCSRHGCCRWSATARTCTRCTTWACGTW